MKIVLRLSCGKAAFVYPVPPAPPTAILVPWFKSRSRKSRFHGDVRVFGGGWGADAQEYQPAAIAGTWPQMEALLGRKIPSLTHAVIVLVRPGDSLLSMEQRQQLWRTFRVPVFEQIIGAHGALLAAECEAHAGLHIESPKLETAGWSIEHAPCGCGRSTPRIGRVGQIEEILVGAASMR